MNKIYEGIIERFTNPVFILDFIICIFLIGLFSWFILSKIKRRFVFWSLIINDLTLLISIVLGLELVSTLSVGYFIVAGVVYVIINISDFRYHILNNVRSNKRKNKEGGMTKENMYRMIGETIKSLSRTKTGAIITFEKTTKLDEIIKSGTLINAPVCSELLMTIFYPGTRLHDGAVVIRGDTILAASVYYTPTTRALTGKYGSRHRAAFGISEISDAVTIVVSEETGRISITYKAQMESCSYDSFLDTFTSFMNDSE